MFENLAELDKIIVTGPQRSGTRICSRMIAADLGYKWVQENGIGTDLESVRNVLSEGKVVVHGPAISYLADLFDDDVGIVFMRRSIEDITASEKRIGWHRSDWGEFSERGRYSAKESDIPISQLKYIIWDYLQRDRVKYYLNVDYESLSGHPLWVPKEKRTTFQPGQTEEE